MPSPFLARKWHFTGSEEIAPFRPLFTDCKDSFPARANVVLYVSGSAAIGKA
jgi:hypothetical protein